MAKDKAVDATPSSSKKDKKDKKRKHSEVTAVDDSTLVETPAKKEKKDKKEKKEKRKSEVVEVDDGGVEVEVKDEEADKKQDVKFDVPLAALVPFANPLCGEKEQKKVLKGVKKAAKSKSLKRGVKEVVKSLRKSAPANPSTSTSSSPRGIVVLAADISPMDVISHIPVLCEDHGIPYLYVPSRAELGAAGATKRPTSVVLIGKDAGKGVEAEGKKEWEESFGELVKVAVKMGQTVRV